MDIRPPFRILSICTGGGGLDLGLHLAVPDARTVCCVEHEAYACEVLATRMEEGRLDKAPIWSDLRTFDGKPWRGVVDCVTGGYPCQPISCAGDMLGEKDARYLWPEVARIVRESNPRVVFFENVANHVNIGFRQVGQDLLEMGYLVEAGFFAASEVGATHIRKRFFILGVKSGDEIAIELANSARSRHPAWIPGEDGQGTQVKEGGQPQPKRRGRQVDKPMANPSSARRQQVSRGPHGDEVSYEGRSQEEMHLPTSHGENMGGDLADSSRPERRQNNVDGRCPEQGGDEGRQKASLLGQHGEILGPAGAKVPIFPPGPESREGWEEILGAEPLLEPALRGVADELANRMASDFRRDRTNQLRLLGNGVVPACAGHAFGVLVHRLVQYQWPETAQEEGWKAF